MKIDFLARQAYFVDHLAPIWDALPASERGVFYALNESVKTRALRLLSHPNLAEYVEEGEQPGDSGHHPIVTAGYGDAIRAADFDPQRPVVLLEHGIGLTFGKAAYADGLGQREKISLMPVQSRYVLQKVHPDLANKPHPVIGVPKMDRYLEMFNSPVEMPRDPVIGIAFHHGSKDDRPGVRGSAWEHYVEILPELAAHHRLLLHAHPAADQRLLDAYLRLADQYPNTVTITDEFEDIMRRASVYLNDSSSTTYEFCVTHKPVILLNAPWFDKKEKYGIRFWDYTNIGLQADEPDQLFPLIDRCLANPIEFESQQRWMVHDLMPGLGGAADLAVAEILKHVNIFRMKTTVTYAKKQEIFNQPEVISTPRPAASKKITVRPGTERGVIYMCFGERAQKEMIKSVTSLYNTGCDLPVAAITDDLDISYAVDGIQVIDWGDNESPYDVDKASHFQFRAGRVKPSIYRLSPFKETLYVDCDLTFLQSPEIGFNFLNRWDFVIAQERLLVSQLYNLRSAGWTHNLREREATVEEFGGNGDFPFWNSGLFFFRKNAKVRTLFGLWEEEWKKWEQWDEQLALMRAVNRSEVRVFVLGETWNHPHRGATVTEDPGATLILHEYGKGAARSDVAEVKKASFAEEVR